MPRCRQCKAKFEAYEFNGKFCKQLDCQVAKGLHLLDKKKKQDKKDWNARKKVLTVTAKSKNHKAGLQLNINKLARMIDARFKMSNCICCTLPLDKRTAGAHFHSVGSNETIRFNLHNIHTSTFYCNSHKDTHHSDYKIGLVKRYGKEYYEYIEYSLQQHPLVKLTEQEVYDKKLLTAKLVRDFDTFDFTNPILARDQLNRIIGIYQDRI